MKTFRVKVNGKEYEVEIEETGTTEELGKVARKEPPSIPRIAQSAIASTPKTAAAMAQRPAADGKITAPMPGTVLSVACASGQSVKKGDTLLILEAMKMENEIKSPADGTVQALNVSQGQSVDAGELLVQLSV